VAQQNTGVPYLPYLASRKILIEQNIKKQTGPALCVLCGIHHRALIINREGTARGGEGENWGFSYLPGVSTL
jgi:hypothetical protein